MKRRTRLILSQLAWLIAFIASIIADIQNPYPKYAWWTVAYQLCCIIGIFIVFATDAANHYSLAVSDDIDRQQRYS
jgi:SHO1 osmosensor